VVTSLQACDDDALLDRMEAAAIRMLRAGVTTVRDLGDRNYLSLKLGERSRAADATIIPDIIAAGPPITTSGGHCHFLAERRMARLPSQRRSENGLRRAARSSRSW
jgi:imidazolonepropionase-like amidohydrolase